MSTPLERTAAVLAALADPLRLRIVHLLWLGQPQPFAVGTLVTVLKRPQPTVSRHLAVLLRAGLVACRQRGRERHYALPEVQAADHAAILGALESFVASAPQVRADAERWAARSESLTGPSRDATLTLHVDDIDGDPAMTEVLRALSHPTRRQLLDDVGARPGATLSEVASRFVSSRAAIGKHLAALERVGLVVSRREGRRRRLYPNPVPIQLVYDRWTDRFSAPLAQHVAAIKYAAEKGRR